MSWKVLVTAPPFETTGSGSAAMLRETGCEIIYAVNAGFSGGPDLARSLAGVDAVIAATEPYPAALLQSPEASRLKIISRWGVGYDAIDVAAATARGIVIAYTPGLLDEAVADYTFALLLSLARHVADGHLSMRGGIWLPQWGEDLAGKTLGIVGYGRIGRAVARRARAFNLRVLACDATPKAADLQSAVGFVSLDELLAQSDFITLHAALTPATRGLMGEAQLRRMKPSARLINTARGHLVDEAALLRALTEGWIAGVALDVYADEPLPPRHPFRSAPNILLSPHQASASVETGRRVSETAAQAVIDLMQGRPPRLVLNPEVFAPK
jgi:phosphoglycerate dehydrogenase-like enzyme